MLRFEDIATGQILTGVEQGKCIEVIVLQIVSPNAATLIYKNEDGSLRDRLLTREDEANLSIAKSERPWSFEVSAQDFKRAAEAYRISLAYLFDPMMAVHTSNVQPLPHQITAVYESMLPRQPLRSRLLLLCPENRCLHSLLSDFHRSFGHNSTLLISQTGRPSASTVPGLPRRFWRW